MIVLVLPFFFIIIAIVAMQALMADAVLLQDQFLGVLQQTVMAQSVQMAFQESTLIPTVMVCHSPLENNVYRVENSHAQVWIYRCLNDERLHYRIIWNNASVHAAAINKP